MFLRNLSCTILLLIGCCIQMSFGQNNKELSTFNQVKTQIDSTYYFLNDSLLIFYQKADEIAGQIGRDNSEGLIIIPEIPPITPKLAIIPWSHTVMPEIPNGRVNKDSLPQEFIRQVEAKLEKELNQYANQHLRRADESFSEIQSALTSQQVLANQQVKMAQLTSSASTKIVGLIQENTIDLENIQKEISLLKQKYDYLPNCNDLSTAKKRSSLNGSSALERLCFSGNFSVSDFDPLTMDFNPSVGYRFNTLFEVGLIGSFNGVFSAIEDKYSYGGGSYLRHTLLKGFFGQGEYQYLHVSGTTETSADTNHQLALGLGYEIPLSHALSLQTLVLYNLTHDNLKELSNGPVIFRTGIRVTNIGSGKGKEKLQHTY